MVACIEIGMEWYGLLLYFYDKDSAESLVLLVVHTFQNCTVCRFSIYFSLNALKIFLEKQTGISVNFP